MSLLSLAVEKTYAVGLGVQIPKSNTTNYNYSSYTYALLNYAIYIGLFLSALMIVYGGIKYILSQGNQTQINDAKDVLFSAMIGFGLLLMIALILKTLGIPLRSS